MKLQPFLLYRYEDGFRPDDFREDYHVHLLCREGSMGFHFAGRQFKVKPHNLVIWQRSSMIYDIHYESDFKADFLLISSEFLRQYNPEMVWAMKGFVYIKAHPVYELDEEQWLLCENDFQQLWMRISQTDHVFHHDVMGRQLQLLLFDMWQIYSHDVQNLESSSMATQHFRRFMQLLQQFSFREREVTFYSDKLCISPKYLLQVCQQVSNISASDWISYYASNELIMRLNDSSQTLTQICDEMQFSSLPFFSRYVKKVLGTSPSEYRKKKGI